VTWKQANVGVVARASSVAAFTLTWLVMPLGAVSSAVFVDPCAKLETHRTVGYRYYLRPTACWIIGQARCSSRCQYGQVWVPGP
jgi:hypothetical protein